MMIPLRITHLTKRYGEHVAVDDLSLDVNRGTANPFAVFNTGLALNSLAHHRFTLDATASSLQWLSTT